MQLIICDWNGTPFDDAFAWIQAHRLHFQELGVTPPTEEEIRSAIYDGSWNDIPSLYNAQDLHFSWEELNRTVGRHYLQLAESATLRPGSLKTFSRLRSRGFALHLLSASNPALAEPFLTKHGMYAVFGESVMLGRGHKTEAIAELLEGHSVRANEACLVTDTPGDVLHAREAGVVSIALATEHVCTTALANSQPDHTVQNMGEVLSLV